MDGICRLFMQSVRQTDRDGGGAGPRFRPCDQGVSISGDSTVTVGSSISLSASVSPSDAAYNGISWSSSDTGIATVDNGKVTGVAAAGAVTAIKHLSRYVENMEV